MVTGGVAPGVARSPEHRQGLVGVVQPRPQRVMSEAALEVAFGVFFVRVRGDQRGVEVDHDLTDRLAGGPRPRELGTGELPTGGPGPIPGLSSSHPDPGEHPAASFLIVADRCQDPPDRRGRRHGPGWAVQALMVSHRLDVADRDRSVGDRDRDIDEHPARVMAGAALSQPIGGLAQQRR